MLKHKRIKVGRKHIEALCINLQSKNFILLRGQRGYIMCGYLDLRVADKFRDVAVKVTGVSTIDDVLSATVHSCSLRAKRLGIKKGQAVREALKAIA